MIWTDNTNIRARFKCDTYVGINRLKYDNNFGTNRGCKITMFKMPRGSTGKKNGKHGKTNE